MDMVGASAPAEGLGDSPGGKTDQQEATENAKNQKGFIKKFAGVTRSITGIQFSTAAFLKQSQIFTSTVGVIFQLMGALVDVILAPFIPILIPAIQWIAKMIPVVAKISQGIADTIIAITNWFKALFANPTQTIKDGLKYIGDNAVEWIKAGLGVFNMQSKWSFILTSMAKWFLFFPKMIPKLISLLPAVLRGLKNAAMFLLKVFAPPVYRFFKVIGIVINWFKEKFTLLRNSVKVKNIMDGLKRTIKTFMAGIWEKLGAAVGKIPMLGKAGKAIAGLAKASKAIPVLGAVATAGFGTYETIRATQKYGWKAGIAYGTKTALATGLTLGGASAAGLAVDVLGSMQLNKDFGGSYLTLEVQKEGSDGTTGSSEVQEIIRGQSKARVFMSAEGGEG